MAPESEAEPTTNRLSADVLAGVDALGEIEVGQRTYSVSAVASPEADVVNIHATRGRSSRGRRLR